MNHAWLIVPFLGFFWAAPAAAGLSICNKSEQTAYVAVGWSDGGDWKSQGWFKVERESCVEPISGNLTNRHYYAYAKAEGNALFWSGEHDSDNSPFCVADRVFFYRNANQTNCSYKLFHHIDTGGNQSAIWKLGPSQKEDSSFRVYISKCRQDDCYRAWVKVREKAGQQTYGVSLVVSNTTRFSDGWESRVKPDISKILTGVVSCNPRDRYIDFPESDFLGAAGKAAVDPTDNTHASEDLVATWASVCDKSFTPLQ